MSQEKSRVFVFGSNLAGRHGAGSAKEAVLRHGAKPGKGSGHHGNSYAIPTKDQNLIPLPLYSAESANSIENHIAGFIYYANSRPDLIFDVVKIGCGLAGYNESQIAPMFSGAPDNVNLPEGWRNDS